MTQPALSKQITDLETEYQFHLFTRDRRRIVELTDAGRVFVQEARSALSHTERAVHLARAAQRSAADFDSCGAGRNTDQGSTHYGQKPFGLAPTEACDCGYGLNPLTLPFS